MKIDADSLTDEILNQLCVFIFCKYNIMIVDINHHIQINVRGRPVTTRSLEFDVENIISCAFIEIISFIDRCCYVVFIYISFITIFPDIFGHICFIAQRFRHLDISVTFCVTKGTGRTAICQGPQNTSCIAILCCSGH